MFSYFTTFLLSHLVLTQHDILACQPILSLYNGGYRLRELQTTEDPDLLFAKIDAFDNVNDSDCASTDSSLDDYSKLSKADNKTKVTFNLRTGEVIKGYSEVAVIPRPEILKDPRSNYKLDRQDGTLCTSDGADVASFDWADDDSYYSDFSFFVSKKLKRAYIFGETCYAVRVTIVDLITNETSSSRVDTSNLPALHSGHFSVLSSLIQNVYDDVQIAELPGSDGLCVKTNYVFFNETAVMAIQSLGIDSDDFTVMDALVHTNTDRAYVMWHNLTSTDDECGRFYINTIEPYMFVEMSISTGQIIRQISLDPSGLAEAIETPDQDAIQTPGGLCFSGTSLIDVVGKGQINMQDLRVGDKVYVGHNKYEPVYTFAHFSPGKVAEFLQIAAGDTSSTLLEISPDHMLFVKGGHSVPASAIQVGDYILNGSGDLIPVKAVHVVKREGVYAPFTPSGSIVVNGIKASAYVTFQRNEFELTVGGVRTGLTYQWLSHAFLLPYCIRCVHRKCEERYTADGINVWMDGPKRATMWLLRQDDVVQLYLGVPMLICVGLLAWTLVLASYFCELSVLSVGFGATCLWCLVPSRKKKKS
jgi:hypothetical protein